MKDYGTVDHTKEYVSPKVEKLEFNFNSIITGSNDHKVTINSEEGECGQSEDTVVFSESYGFCNVWASTDDSCR